MVLNCKSQFIANCRGCKNIIANPTGSKRNNYYKQTLNQNWSYGIVIVCDKNAPQTIIFNDLSRNSVITGMFLAECMVTITGERCACTQQNLLSYRFLMAVFALSIDALIKRHLNVTIINEHDAFIESIVSHTLITDSS